MGQNNYLPLIHWVIDRTNINESKEITNNDLKRRFLKEFPQYESNSEQLSWYMGILLRLVYGNELKQSKTTQGTLYNVEIKEREA